MHYGSTGLAFALHFTGTAAPGHSLRRRSAVRGWQQQQCQNHTPQPGADPNDQHPAAGVHAEAMRAAGREHPNAGGSQRAADGPHDRGQATQAPLLLCAQGTDESAFKSGKYEILKPNAASAI